MAKASPWPTLTASWRGGEIVQRARAQGAHVAAVDLDDAGNVESFGVRLLWSVLSNRFWIGPAPRTLADFRQWHASVDTREDFESFFGDLLDVRRLLDGDLEASEVLDIAVEAAETLAGRDDRRRVVLLAGVDRFEQLDGGMLRRRIRPHDPGRQRIVFLFSGTGEGIQKYFAYPEAAFPGTVLLLDPPILYQ